jgi:hypothetical protein
MNSLTLPALLSMLEAKPGAKIVGVITATEPKMTVKSRATKEPNPYLDGKLVHMAHRTIILGADYEGLVNKARAAEGVEEPFVAEALWNGKGAKHRMYTVQHVGTGAVYFAYKPQVAEPTHTPKVHADEYQFNGRTLTPAEVADLKANYLPKPSENKKQAVDKEVFWRTLELCNLVTVQFAGEQYQIDHSVPANVSHL